MKRFLQQFLTLPFIIGFIIVLLLSTYKLTESPPTWMDEGIITQVARTMALDHANAVRIAPNELAPAGFGTTGYTVTFPISIIFSIFGTGILQARLVMVFFIIGAYTAMYFLIRKRIDRKFLYSILLLFVTFAPIYGQGKNVLGEVPGIFFMLCTLLFLDQLVETTDNKSRHLLFFGLFAGLTIVTKPIFFLLIPALIILAFLYRKQLFTRKKDVILLVASVLIPLVVWAWLQFQGLSVGQVLQLYKGNPHNASLVSTFMQSVKRLFTEAQPAYTALLFLTWTMSGILRYSKKQLISAAECLAWLLSGAMLACYMFTVGYYRYFFIAEVISLVFFIPSLVTACAEKYKKPLFVLLSLLILFQMYQTVFHSWVFGHYASSRSRMLQEHVGTIPSSTAVFFYQLPEAVNFIARNDKNYYQYFEITPSLRVGEKELEVLKKAIPDEIIIPQTVSASLSFPGYHVKESFDNYQIWVK